MDDQYTGLPAAFNLERYRRHVAHLSLPEAQERDMLAALHQVVQSFVDRAFGDDAVQLAQNAGDASRISGEAEALSVIDSSPISSSTHTDLSEAFGDAAAQPDGRKR